MLFAAALLLVLDHVSQSADPLDFHFEDIAMSHENRRRARRSDPTWGSGNDYIARSSRLIATLINSINAATLKMS